MESIDKIKLYMLLELEKIRQNTNQLTEVFPFPIRLLDFQVILLKDNNKMIFDLRKKNVEDDWCLYSRQKILNNDFDDEGIFHFKDREAFKVLKVLVVTIETDIHEEDVGNIEDLISSHHLYLKGMEDFTKTKECEDDKPSELLELENRHKDKNSFLLETLCERSNELNCNLEVSNN